jgi:substrate import-associated zinc metallohydrolase lipoprotein
LTESIIDTSEPELNEIDKWIMDSLTIPYNMEIKYRWDDSEVDNSRILIPPELSKVIPFLQTVKKVWIDPYVNEGGIDFVKNHIIKQMILVGSKYYNGNGTEVNGQAEGGRKIVLFRINYFSKDDKTNLKAYFHTIHHEFAHVLHQTIMYPMDYKLISAEYYTSTWYDHNLAYALDKGFISAYSMCNPDEDFVEMVSTMLTYSYDEWETLVNSAPEEGRAIIRLKEEYIVSYFENAWKINIYDLQKAITNAVNNL